MSEFLFEGKPIQAEDNETVLSALLNAGVQVKNGCKAGACQACLLHTDESAPPASQKGIDESITEAGGFLSCQAKASQVKSVNFFDPNAFPTYPATVLGKEQLSEDVIQVSLTAPEFKIAPGKFIQLIHSSGTARPYSIATSVLQNPNQIDLHIRILPDGEMSKIITNAKPGDDFTLQGPYGKNAYRPSKSKNPIIMIGSGTGLAPLYAVACHALQQNHQEQINLFFGANTPNRLYFQEELQSLSKTHPQFNIHFCADNDADECTTQGSPLDVALTKFPNLEDNLVYLCGHPALVKAAQKKCFLAGANLKDISADPFEPYT